MYNVTKITMEAARSGIVVELVASDGAPPRFVSEGWWERLRRWQLVLSYCAHEEQEAGSQWDPPALPLAHFLLSHGAMRGWGWGSTLLPWVIWTPLLLRLHVETVQWPVPLLTEWRTSTMPPYLHLAFIFQDARGRMSWRGEGEAMGGRGGGEGGGGWRGTAVQIN